MYSKTRQLCNFKDKFIEVCENPQNFVFSKVHHPIEYVQHKVVYEYESSINISNVSPTACSSLLGWALVSQPYDVNSEICLLACFLDTSSLIIIMAETHLSANQNYIKLEWCITC